MTAPVYAPGSQFESCPAATGVTEAAPRCGTYPDGAHRCRWDRLPHPRHGCLCGIEWLCISPTDYELLQEVLAVDHAPRHAAS